MKPLNTGWSPALVVLVMLGSLVSDAHAESVKNLASVITGPGVYTLEPGIYEGAVSLNLAPGQLVDIRGTGVIFSRPDSGPIFFVRGGGSISFSGSVAGGIVFDGITSRAIDVDGAVATLDNVTFRNFNDVIFVSNASRLTITNSLMTNIGSGIIVTSSQGVQSIRLEDSIFQGRGRSRSNTKAIQFQGITEAVTITGCTIEDFDLGAVKQDSTAQAGPIIVSNSTIRRTNAGLLLLQQTPSILNYVTGTITNTTFGDSSQPFPGGGENTKAIQIEGPGELVIRDSRFTRWIFGVQALSGPRITVSDSEFFDMKNGIQGENFYLQMQSENGTGSVFRDLRTNDNQPPRGILVAQNGSSPFESALILNPPLRFVNIWDPSVNNSPTSEPEFSFGDGVNVKGGARLVMNGANDRDFYFERVGRCITVANGLLEIDYAWMVDCVRGILMSDAGDQTNRVVIRNNYFNAGGLTFLQRHDAISASRSVLSIHDNYIENTGGGIVFVDSNDGFVFNNTVLNAKRNSFTCAQTTRAEVYDNYFQRTIGNPDENTGLDNIYVDRSVNVNIFRNIILDSEDNGVFIEGSQARVFQNFIAGQANDGVLVVQSERPGFDNKSFAEVYDNTILNQGNYGLKVLDEKADLRFYRNIMAESEGAAFPSARNPQGFTTSGSVPKVVGGMEVNGEQARLILRSNVVTHRRGFGIEVIGRDGDIGRTPIFLVAGNAFMNTGRDAIKLTGTGNRPTIEKNFFLNNGGPAAVEINDASPTFTRNVYGAFPGGRIFLSNNPISVPNNYWGRPEGPQFDLDVENGNFRPFLTQQNIFASSRRDLGTTPIEFLDSTVTRMGLAYSLRGDATASGTTHVATLMRYDNGEIPDGLPALAGASSYFLPMLDQRLRRDAASISFIALLPAGGTHELHHFNDERSEWQLLSGVNRTSAPNSLDRYTLTAADNTLPYGWFAAVPTGAPVNQPPTLSIAQPVADVALPFADNSVNFRVSASDSDGSVVRIEWSTNGVNFNSVTAPTSPGIWEFSVNALPVGTTTVSVRAVDNQGAVSPIATRTITRQPEPAVEVPLPSTWYFAEGATLPFLQTFILMANPANESRTVRMDLLFETGAPASFTYTLAANSRQTVELNSLTSYNGGLSTLLTEVNGRGFAAERAMYVRFGGSGKWNAAHAAVGLTTPQPEWFFPEGSTGVAGPAGAPFQTFILLANPTANAVAADVTYFPEGATSFTERVTIAANSRLTLEPGTRFPSLRSAAFSTRVRSVNGAGILGERAMWWSDPDWTLSPFQGGHASPGLPGLSNNWYFAEGDTRSIDDFILFVNPGATAANITVDYLLTDRKITRSFTVGANSRRTVNVTFDAEGAGPNLRHGTTIRSSQPIAVERSMYWSRGRFGWVDGHNSLAATQPSTKWLLPEGATVPVAVGVLRTEILIANPGTVSADIQLRFLLEGRPPITRSITLAGERATTVVANDIAELGAAGFATEVTATVPIVVERSMYFDTNEPETISRVGGTCSLGIPLAPAEPAMVIKGTAETNAGWDVQIRDLLPTPTPTPTVTPLPK